jgi:RimJ/RimL family protein N-acetyltransferase
VLVTDRLRIAPVAPSDAEDLFEVLADPRLGWWTGEASPRDVDEVRARIRRWAEQEPVGQRWHNWIVRKAVDDEPVAYVQATVAGSHAWLAWVTRADVQRRGYATEAARAVLGRLVDGGVDRIEATIADGHAASEGVARNLGMGPTDEVVDGERVWRLA